MFEFLDAKYLTKLYFVKILHPHLGSDSFIVTAFKMGKPAGETPFRTKAASRQTRWSSFKKQTKKKNSLLASCVNSAPLVSHQKECRSHILSQDSTLDDCSCCVTHEMHLNPVGDLLEESQSEASRLRQRVEELVRDNEALKSTSFAASLCAGGPVQTETQSRSNRLEVTLIVTADITLFHPRATQVNETRVIDFRQTLSIPHRRAGGGTDELCREDPPT